MESREKIGAAVLVGFFLVLFALLFFTVSRPDGPSRSIEDNVMIDQRMKNRGLN